MTDLRAIRKQLGKPKQPMGVGTMMGFKLEIDLDDADFGSESKTRHAGAVASALTRVAKFLQNCDSINASDRGVRVRVVTARGYRPRRNHFHIYVCHDRNNHPVGQWEIV